MDSGEQLVMMLMVILVLGLAYFGVTPSGAAGETGQAGPRAGRLQRMVRGPVGGRGDPNSLLTSPTFWTKPNPSRAPATLVRSGHSGWT